MLGPCFGLGCAQIAAQIAVVAHAFTQATQAPSSEAQDRAEAGDSISHRTWTEPSHSAK